MPFNLSMHDVLFFCAIIIFVAMIVIFAAKSIINYRYERKEKHIKMLSGAIAAGLDAMIKKKKEIEEPKKDQS